MFFVSCLSAEKPLLHLGNLRMKGVGLAVAAAILLVLIAPIYLPIAVLWALIKH